MNNNLPLKAYEDIEFLKSEHCRPIRLQMELLRPDVIMAEQGVRSTVVIFGSARTLPPEQIENSIAELNTLLEQTPPNSQEYAELTQRIHSMKRRAGMSRYYRVAEEMAHLISRECQNEEDDRAFVIMTGGGGGIMEAGNRGAAKAGAKSIGLNISLPFEQLANDYITRELSFHFHYFSIRKMHFLLRAKALCAFPGGFGTLDELFETLTLIQTRKIEPIPILLFGKEFWENLIHWDLLVQEELISPEDLDIFHFCETAEEGWRRIQQFYSETHPKEVKQRTPPIA